MRRSKQFNNQIALEISPTSSQLADWIKRSQVGHRDAQTKLYEYIAEKYYRVICKTVGPSNADDVMQEFMIQLIAKIKQFRFESSFDTWAYRIAVNQCLQYLRKTVREKYQEKQYACSNRLAHNANELRSLENTELLDMALQRISGEQRAILHMKEVEELNYEVISGILRVPLGTVGSRLNKARKELCETMIQMGWDE
ncbi:MAG: polymerase sigma factor SigE [Planctomycetota bacterium]|jgi:RNA polymerase sigma-70 factor (ECF subfamily)